MLYQKNTIHITFYSCYSLYKVTVLTDDGFEMNISIKDYQWFVSSGLYMSYLLRGKYHVESTYETINPGKGNIRRYENNDEIDLENTNRFDLGPLAGGGLSYPINNQLRISIEGSFHLGLIDMNKNLDLKNYKHYSRHNYSYNLLFGCSYKLQENKKK